jgi:hypothetical protein
MADDVTTPSNLSVAPVEKEKLEEEPSKRVVHTRVHHSAWDRRLFSNPHALAIYLEFFLFVEPRQKGLKNVNVKMTMFVFIIELGFSMMAIIIGYETQSTPFPCSIEPNT